MNTNEHVFRGEYVADDGAMIAGPRAPLAPRPAGAILRAT